MKTLWLAAMCICLTLSCRMTLWGQASQVGAASQSTDCTEKGDRRYMVCPGAWSGKAVALFNTWGSADTNPDRQLDLLSPDGEKTIRVRGFHVRLQMAGKSYWTPFGNMHDAEVGWAPDSTRLFITWSESGELGAWHTQVYDVTNAGLREISGATRRVRSDMLVRMKKAPFPKWVTDDDEKAMWSGLDYCADDTVGSQWLNGSREILVAVLAGPDSGCKYMGDFVAYRIQVDTGRILKGYTEKEAADTFGSTVLPRIDPDDDEL